jgi:hypothetical protein
MKQKSCLSPGLLATVDVSIIIALLVEGLRIQEHVVALVP